MANVINQRMDAKAIRDFIGNIYGKTFFICGPEKFMEAMRENLKSIGVHDFQIETEGFSMIADAGVWQKFKNTAYAFGLATAIFLLPFFFIQRSNKSSVLIDNSATVDFSPAEIPAVSSVSPASSPVSAESSETSTRTPESVSTYAPTPTSTPKPIPIPTTTTPAKITQPSPAPAPTPATPPKPKTKVS